MASTKNRPGPGPDVGAVQDQASRAAIAEAAYARLLHLLRPAAPLEEYETACKIGHMIKELGLI